MFNILLGKWRLSTAALGASLLLSLPSWAATAPTQLPPHSVYGTAPPVTLLVYSLAPDLLAGWNFPLNKIFYSAGNSTRPANLERDYKPTGSLAARCRKHCEAEAGWAPWPPTRAKRATGLLPMPQ